MVEPKRSTNRPSPRRGLFPFTFTMCDSRMDHDLYHRPPLSSLDPPTMIRWPKVASDPHKAYNVSKRAMTTTTPKWSNVVGSPCLVGMGHCGRR